MALTRAQYLAPGGGINPLAGQVQGVKQGAGVTIAADGTISFNSATATGVVTRLIAGSNITISPVTGTGAVTINATGGGGGGGLTGLQEIDDISGSFNGSTLSFPITVSGGQPIPAGPGTSQLVIAVGGILQTPGVAFTFDNATDTLTFTSAPSAGLTFTGYVGGNANPILAITTSAPISGGGTSGTVNIGMASSGVAAGSYTTANITVDSFGRVTAASNGSTSAGTVTSVNVSGGSTGLSFGGGPITTSGTITMGGVLSPASGGTGATSVGAAINNLLPSQAGNSGRTLVTNGANPSWGDSVRTLAAADGSIVIGGSALNRTARVGISSSPSLGSIVDSDLFLVERGGVNYRVSALALKTYFGGGMNNVIYGVAIISTTGPQVTSTTVSHPPVNLAASYIITSSAKGFNNSGGDDGLVATYVSSRTTTSFTITRAAFSTSRTAISYFLVY